MSKITEDVKTILPQGQAFGNKKQSFQRAQVVSHCFLAEHLPRTLMGKGEKLWTSDSSAEEVIPFLSSVQIHF